MKNNILRHTLQALLTLLAFHLGGQSTPLFNYLDRQNIDLSSSESLKFDQLWASGAYRHYEFVSLNEISECFEKSNVTLNLPGKTTTFKIDRAQTTIKGNFYWMGTPINDEEGGVFTLSDEPSEGYIASINFDAEELFYQLFPLGPQIHVLLQVEPDVYGESWDCGVESTPPDAEDEEDYDEETDIRSTCVTKKIRILFLYTQNTTTSGLVPADVSNHVIAELNTTTSASGLQADEIRFENAGVLPLFDFVESTSARRDIRRLVDFAPAIDLRFANFADLVILLTNASPYNAGGVVADINTNFENAFAIAQIHPASSGFTATHEVGHLLGARHQRCRTCGGALGGPIGSNGCDELTLGHGFKIGQVSRTIMYQHRCDSTTRIGRWSNPDVPFGSFPTGNFWNNNARKLRNNAGKVACFFGPPPTNNDNMIVSISGPNGSSCGGAIWYANISNNQGSPPHTYRWEYSANGISNWLDLNVSESQILEEQIIYSGLDIECGDKYYIRVVVMDSSSPPLMATNSKQLEAYCCLQDDSSEQRSYSSHLNAKLYPNPNKGYFYYSLIKSHTIDLFNAAGQRQALEYHRVSDDYIFINLSNAPNGIYYVEEKDNNNVLTINKLVKI